jgi:hypothetical protein
MYQHCCSLWSKHPAWNIKLWTWKIVHCHNILLKKYLWRRSENYFFPPLNTIKAFDEVEVHLHSFLYSTLEGGEWSTSHSTHFAPQEVSTCNHRMNRWHSGDPRTGLSVVVERKFSYLFQEIRGKSLSLFPRYWQLIWRLITGWAVRGSNPVGGEIFRTRPDRPWCPPNLLYNGYRVFLGVKAAGAWFCPSDLI